MKTAMYRNREITADEGVDLRDAVGRESVDFRCPECDRPAKVMRASRSGSHPAHFEHHERNNHCSRVHHAR